MIIKQLSIFLENKTGRLTEVTDILGQAGVNMSAFSVAETSDFGILRVVVSDPEKAFKVLKEKHISVSLTDVVCLSVPNEPGALAKALKCISAGNMAIEYLYAFSTNNTAMVVIKPENISRCIEILQTNHFELKTADELYKL